MPEFFERARYHEDVHHKLGHSRRHRRHDLGVAFDDDGMPVMGVVAVRAKEGLAHRHEAGDLEKKPVRPSRAEGGAMAGFMFARLRAGRIEGAVGEQRDGGAPVSSQRHGQTGKACQKQEIQREITRRAGVMTTHQLFEFGRFDLDSHPAFRLRL